ncbi:sensor histidine kinase [Kordiimonas aquimaris]|uniref:sensor histidine kinase n=1 Tax=Kordiimonas aquimaris TaxID=707591 RepID=UPI0021D1DBAD|nr:histidine kinase [Kordiimonas aquimaris]
MQRLNVTKRARKLAMLAAGGFVLWITLTLIFSVSSYIDAIRLDQYMPYQKHFVDTGYGFGVWAFIGPVLFAFASSARFVEARGWWKLLYFILAAVFALAVMLIYVSFFAAPHWGYEPLDFFKVQRVVEWLGDMFLFIIVLLLGYVFAVVQRAQQSALTAAHLQSSLAQEQAKKNAFEATYLRGRLGSHFVMNALSNVLGLVRLGDTARAEDATILLSDILRGMTSDDTGNLVPLSTEVTLAEKYLAFQRIRYPSLTSSFDVEPSALNAQVPSQLLQPLLENVFKHASLPKIATLVITARLKKDRMVITVANNSIAKAADTLSKGEGMTLTTLRLRSLIEEPVTIDRSYIDGWYAVTLNLPFIQNGEEPL